MTPDPADLGRVLFADHGHTCCECCDGYCPQDDAKSSATWAAAVAVTIHGIAYQGLAHLLVRADVATLPDGSHPFSPNVRIDWHVPATRPHLSTQPMMPETLHRIDRAGLTVHDDGGPQLHLYRADEHVGWTMPCSNSGWPRGINVADLPLIRRVADATGRGLNEAAMAAQAVLDALGVAE